MIPLPKIDWPTSIAISLLVTGLLTLVLHFPLVLLAGALWLIYAHASKKP